MNILKWLGGFLSAILLAPLPTFAQDSIGSPDTMAVADGACHPAHDGPVLKLAVNDLKKRKGQFRIELYGDDPDLFLEGEGRFYKLFLPLPENKSDRLCITAPAKGKYGLLVIHDIDNDGKPDFFGDGFGLSTNPKLALRRPRLKEALFEITEDETLLDINMQYVVGGKRKKGGPRGRR